MGQFRVQVVENLFAKLQAIIQHPQCILAHRLAFEKFWETVAEIKAGLDFASSEWNRALVSSAVPNPAYWRIVHRRPRYIVGWMPRVKGGSPGRPADAAASRARSSSR